MSVLRDRMIEDLRLRNRSPRTIEAYVAAGVKVVRHTGRSPELLTAEEIRLFQVESMKKEVSWSQFNQVVSGLRFFYRTTLGRPDVVRMLAYGKKPRRLPVVLSVEEVGWLLSAAR